jgi:hypothetical protein
MEKNQNFIQEPDYIEEHEDFKIMKCVYTPELLNLSQGVWKQAFRRCCDVNDLGLFEMNVRNG